MNIKITDLKLVELLREATLVQVPVGSWAYGLNNPQSDRDWLHIYATPKEELRSPFRNHHQFQYKDEKGDDHLFVSLHNFIRNLVTGDSLLNFEALHWSDFKYSMLGPLIHHRTMFNSVTVVRAYLGKAKKDFKNYEKLGEGHVRTKKLVHLMRSFHFASAILDGNFNLTGGVVRTYWHKVMGCSPEKQAEYAANFNAQVDFLRDKLNNNQQFIPTFMRVEDQKYIDSIVLAITKLPEYKTKRRVLKGFDMTPFYQSNEVGIIYET